MKKIKEVTVLKVPLNVELRVLDTSPSYIETLRDLYDAFIPLKNKTDEQFDAIEKAGKMLAKFPPSFVTLPVVNK